MVAAAFLMNCFPASNGMAAPHERLYGRKQDMSMLCVWSSKAYATRPSKQARRCASHFIFRRMVGYSSGVYTSRIRSAASGAIMTRRDVEVDETAPA